MPFPLYILLSYETIIRATLRSLRSLQKHAKELLKLRKYKIINNFVTSDGFSIFSVCLVFVVFFSVKNQAILTGSKFFLDITSVKDNEDINRLIKSHAGVDKLDFSILF